MSASNDSPRDQENPGSRPAVSHPASPGVSHLYRLDTLADADTVYVTQGEGNANFIKEMGLCATTAAQGVESVRKTDWSPLAGKQVVILPEFGADGDKYAQAVASQLMKLAPAPVVRDLRLPGSNMGKDVIRQWIKSQKGLPDDRLRHKLEELASETAPLGETPADAGDDESPRNRDSVDDDAGSNRKPKEPSQGEVLLELAARATYFHTPEMKAYATFSVPNRGADGGERVEHHPVRSSAFKNWLTHQFYRERGTGPSRDAMDTTLGTLEARARYDGHEEPVDNRVADVDSPEGPTYLFDLADQRGRAVKITGIGWEVIDSPSVKFRRPGSMRPLPVPEKGGSIDDLRQFFNVRSDTESDWRLVVVVLCSYLRPTGPYPILAIQGEQGSAKTTTTRVVTRLIDPSGILRSPSRDQHSLAIAANRSWVLTIDNLSGMPVWLSDALCRLATGGGFATRTMYADDEETIFSATRPIVLNGIDDIAERPDLLDRAIVLNLPRITGDKRRTEEEFWRLFDAAAPKILGALLDAVSGGIRELPGVQLDRLLRMADFTRWGEAVGRGLGWGEGAFLDAFEQNQNIASVSALEACPVASAVRKLMDYQPAWAGTATALLEVLRSKFVDEHVARSNEWPKKANILFNKLKRTAPALRKEGVNIEFGTSGKQRAISIARDKPGKECEPSSTSSPDEGNPLGESSLAHDEHYGTGPSSFVADSHDGDAPSTTTSGHRNPSSSPPAGDARRNAMTGKELYSSTSDGSSSSDDVDDEYATYLDRPPEASESGEVMEWEIS